MSGWCAFFASRITIYAKLLTSRRGGRTLGPGTPRADPRTGRDDDGVGERANVPADEHTMSTRPARVREGAC